MKLSAFFACLILPFYLIQADAVTSLHKTAARGDSLAAEREKLVEEVLNTIAGREEEPAGDVFENIEVFKRMPAGRLLRVMNIGFGRSLGVGCDHCHDTDEWASDDKRPKRAAREMLNLVQTINGELLVPLQNLDSERPTVNCTTCHRGQVKPALEMPEE